MTSRKEQSLRDYAGIISVYGAIVTVILIVMILNYWFDIDVFGMFGNAK